jgi:biopolymer transport protein ExbB
MIEIFHKGGPIMWPLLLLSITILTVAWSGSFSSQEKKNRNPAMVGDILSSVEHDRLDEAAKLGAGSKDFGGPSPHLRPHPPGKILQRGDAGVPRIGN